MKDFDLWPTYHFNNCFEMVFQWRYCFSYCNASLWAISLLASFFFQKRENIQVHRWSWRFHFPYSKIDGSTIFLFEQLGLLLIWRNKLYKNWCNSRNDSTFIRQFAVNFCNILKFTFKLLDTPLGFTFFSTKFGWSSNNFVTVKCGVNHRHLIIVARHQWHT